MRQYSHGNPTAEEQYMLELINRARAAPADEGKFLIGQKNADIKVAFDFYDVNLNRVKQDFTGYQARPPMTFHPDLLAASRQHSSDMVKNNFQSHTGSDGSTPGSRVNDAGYDWTTTNENIFSRLIPTTLFAHVGLNVDWGPYPNGIQPDLIHRRSIMGIGQDFREIGIGIVKRTGQSAKENGNLSITQNFANREDSPVFLLGVAYSDVNLNGFYDVGEGLAGIQVVPEAGAWYAKTSTSGGYAIPFSITPGASRVTFSGGGLPTSVTRDFSITNQNVKVDLRVAAKPPLVRLVKVDSIAREAGPAAGRVAVFRVLRSGTAGNLQVEIARSISSGRGKASPRDYTLSAVRPARLTPPANSSNRFPVIIPSGERSAEIRVTSVSDQVAEPDEAVAFTLLNSAKYEQGEPVRVKILITK